MRSLWQIELWEAGAALAVVLLMCAWLIVSSERARQNRERLRRRRRIQRSERELVRRTRTW